MNPFDRISGIFFAGILFVFISQFAPLARAEVQYSLTPGVRSYPFGGSLEASAKYDHLLWDRRDDQTLGAGPRWKYSFAQLRAAAASQGTVEVSASYFPISFFEIFAAKSFTDRYFQNSKFDCDVLLCKGRLWREKAGFRLSLGYEYWFGLLSAVKTRAEQADKSRPAYDEVEYLVLNAAGDDLETGIIALGQKTEHLAVSLLHRQSRAIQSGENNQMQAIVIRVMERPEFWTYGLGRYFSSRNDPGLTFFFAYQINFGESLALQ